MSISDLAPMIAPASDGILRRPSLFQLIDASRSAPILWIAGGPGSGKTMLAASYLAERRIPGDWFTARRLEAAVFKDLVRDKSSAGVLVLDDVPALVSESWQASLLELAKQIPHGRPAHHRGLMVCHRELGE